MLSGSDAIRFSSSSSKIARITCLALLRSHAAGQGLGGNFCFRKWSRKFLPFQELASIQESGRKKKCIYNKAVFFSVKCWTARDTVLDLHTVQCKSCTHLLLKCRCQHQERLRKKRKVPPHRGKLHSCQCTKKALSILTAFSPLELENNKSK